MILSELAAFVPEIYILVVLKNRTVSRELKVSFTPSTVAEMVSATVFLVILTLGTTAFLPHETATKAMQTDKSNNRFMFQL